jgi:hypothetical protein
MSNPIGTTCAGADRCPDLRIIGETAMPRALSPVT